jgi:hypothetical protein
MLPDEAPAPVDCAEVRACGGCGAAAASLRSCSRCEAAYYCNISCQRAAWPAHRRLCVRPPPSTLPPPPPPSSASRGAASLSALCSLVSAAGADAARVAALPSAALRELLRGPDAADAAAFARAAWPGCAPADLPAAAPRSLRAALASPALAAARAAAAERAAARGAAVLAAVKARAAAGGGGGAMDAATERGLWPQVFAEAFVRELPAMMAPRPRGALAAAAAPAVASPYHVLAACAYAGGAGRALGDVLSPRPARGWSVAPGPFLDAADAPTWAALVADDCARMAEDAPRWAPDAAAAGAGDAAFTWLNDDECEEAYPALGELLQRLCALPYELNRRVPGALLLAPRPGAALLRRYAAAPAAASTASQPHLLCGATFASNAPAAAGGAPPLGLVAVYAVGAAPAPAAAPGAGPRLLLQALRGGGAPPDDIDVSLGNQLLLHRAGDVLLRPALLRPADAPPDPAAAFFTVTRFLPCAPESSLPAPAPPAAA